MEKYFFKTRLQIPDEECIERCNVMDNGIMIGSYKCMTCPYHVENDMNEYDEMSWIKCSRIDAAVKPKNN